MRFLEKDLEQIIHESDRDSLKAKGLIIKGNAIRQLKIGNYGIADIVTISRTPHFMGSSLCVTVYELKKDKISMSSFLQACRYAKGIKQYLNNRGVEYYDVRIVIIGSEVDLKSDVCYIPDIFDSVEYYTYSYGVEGIAFKKENGYCLNNEGFES